LQAVCSYYMRKGKDINYNPAVSVKENAIRNGVSEATIRYHIKTKSVDRRYERKLHIISQCRFYLQKSPNATRTELQKKTGYSLATIRKYWKYITTEEELIDFDKNKAKKYQLKQMNNFYATHPSATQDLLRCEVFNHKILEPFCGSGTMAEVIKNNGYAVDAYDIIDRGYGEVGDFFRVDYPTKEYDIITNPPYDENLILIIKRCLTLCKNKVALLLPITFLSGKERYDEIYSKQPPSRVYVYRERINIAMDGDFTKFNKSARNITCYAWYIWERDHNGATELRWIKNIK